MRARARHLTALLAVLAVAGCGSDDEPEGEGLPRAAVAQLDARLIEIGRRFADARDNDNPGACDDIANDSFRAIDRVLTSLPADVDPDLRDATEDSFARLRELTSEGCSEVEPPQTETVPPETEIETIPTETLPPETETTPPEIDTRPSDRDEEGNGNGKGNGNGNGNGNGGGGTPPGLGGGGAPAPQSGGGR